MGPATKVAAGGWHTLSLLVDKSVRGWGRNIEGQSTIPTDLGQSMDIDAGTTHSIALRLDGTVRAWGSNTFGERVVPAGLSGVTMVAAGWHHSTVLKSDGTVVCWGDNWWGQCSVPAGLGSVIAIAAGGYNDRAQTIALRADGSVTGWGSDGFGQARPAAELGNNFVQVESGQGFSVGRRQDNSLTFWGWHEWGEENVPLGEFSDVSIGYFHGLALRSNGTVATWGDNYFGQCDLPPSLGSVSAIGTGEFFSIAVRTDGTVRCWGLNADQQCIVPVGTIGVRAVSGGDFHSAALKTDGTVVCWGTNYYGVLSVPSGLGGVAQVACGGRHTVALKADGSIVGWGSNTFGQITAPNTLAPFTRIDAGGFHTVALRADGTVRCWGSNSSGQCSVPVGLGPVTWVAAARASTSVVLPASVSGCGGTRNAGSASVAVSGASWGNVSVWSWTGSGYGVPGGMSAVDLGTYGSVGSECDATAGTFVARAGSSLLVPVDLTVPAAGQPDNSIDVGTLAVLAGRVWLAASGASVLPADLNVPVLRCASTSGSFDIVQSTVPPPAGKFLALTPSSSVAGSTLYSLRLLDLPGSAAVTGATAGQYSGQAIAAEAIDLNGDGFDDLAVLVTFGATTPGQIVVLLNDGSGNLGTTSLLTATAPSPTCIAIGDADGDELQDALVGTSSDNRAQVFINAGQGQSSPFSLGVSVSLGGAPLSAAILNGPSVPTGQGATLAVGVTTGSLHSVEFHPVGGSLVSATLGLAFPPAMLDFQHNRLASIGREEAGLAIFSELTRQFAERTDASDLPADAKRAAVERFNAAVESLNPTDIAFTLVKGAILEQAVRDISSEYAQDPQVQAGLYITIGKTLVELGEPGDALIQFEKALEIRAKEFGANDRRTLEAAGLLDEATLAAQGPERALERVEATLAARREAFGAEDADTLHSARVRAAVLSELSRKKEAIEAMEAVVRVSTTSDPRSLATLQDQIMLAEFYAADGRLEESERTSLSVVDALKMMQAPPKRMLALALSSLGLTQTKLPKKQEQGLEALKSALAIGEEVNGETHPSAFDFRSNLAINLMRADKDADAKVLHERSRRIGQGLKFPPTAYFTFLNDYSYLLSPEDSVTDPAARAAAFQQAIAIAEESDRMLEARLGAGSDLALRVRASLASLYFDSGAFDRAEKSLREVVQRRRTNGSQEGDIKLLDAKADLAQSIAAQGRWKDSVSVLVEAQDAAKRERPAESEARWNVATRLLRYLEQWDRAESAGDAHDKIVPQIREVEALQQARKSKGGLAVEIPPHVVR